MPGNRLPAHPLVVGAAAAGTAPGAFDASKAAYEAQDIEKDFGIEKAGTTPPAAPTPEPGPKPRGKAAQKGATTVQAKPRARLAPEQIDIFCAQADRRPLRMVAGYLGGCQPPGTSSGGQQSTDTSMQLLFLDATLSKWLLLRLADIVMFNRVSDDTAAFGRRDIVWLRPEARVVAGDDSDSVAQSYLNGPFVGVDTLGSSVSGGTFPRPRGLLQEATTPGCCGKTR